MSETAVLESSPEVVEMEASSGPLVNLSSDERAEFRRTGELPKVEPKKEEAAPSSEAKKAESAGEAETPEQKQERTAKPKQTAAERIADLKATIAKIEKGAGIKSEAESTPAKPEAKQTIGQPPFYTRPKPQMGDKNADGTPKYTEYEDFIDDRQEWFADEREAKRNREAAEKAQIERGKAKVDEAKTRYENFEEIGKTFWDEIVADVNVSPTIKSMIDDSDHFADLAYTIGSSKEELAKFKAMPVGKQIRYIALTESLIAEELEGKKQPATEETPAKPKTAAPRPPVEAGGRASSPPDAELAAVAAGDFRAAKAEFTRKALAKLKG